MIKKVLTKLINWEAPKGAHKPSGEEVFQREHKKESEYSKEEEAKRKANIEEDKWQEIKLPEGIERNPE